MYEDLKTILEKSFTSSLIGKQVYHFKSVASTMTIGRKLAKEGATEGTIVIADTQTSGRGRLNRIWLSPENNLYMSIILRPSLSDLPKLIMLASVGVVEAIKQVSGLDASIKWPNDVLINGKKICGILIENEIVHNAVNFSVIGIGLNIDLDSKGCTEIASIATSLRQESNRAFSKIEVITALLAEIEKQYLSSKSSMSVYLRWRDYMNIIGKSIRIKSGQDIVQGIVEDVNDSGSLILRLGDGGLQEIFSGDVTVVKE
jgi:BirA family transcriptional regulator, biotin operon repressor / biotin---[acetyl-CoA-carboxylase] ligase